MSPVDNPCTAPSDVRTTGPVSATPAPEDGATTSPTTVASTTTVAGQVQPRRTAQSFQPTRANEKHEASNPAKWL